MKRFLLAITFLTRLPVPVSKKVSQGEIGKSTPFFPLVGLLVGALLVGIDYLSLRIWPQTIVNIILITCLIAITGGLHLDGFIDTCDGIFSGKDRETTLEIMRDSRTGAMGVLGAICIIALKIGFLSAIGSGGRWRSLLVFPMLGRWGIVCALSMFPYARSTGGLGSPFVEYAKKRYMIWASLQVLVVAIPLFMWKALFLVAAIGLVTWLLGVWLSRRLGGLTGDTYGAICELTETLSLAVMSISPMSVT